MKQDCFFEIIEDNGKKRMSPKCVECCKGKEENKFFWQGSIRGYGPYEVICEICKKIIHTPTTK